MTGGAFSNRALLSILEKLDSIRSVHCRLLYLGEWDTFLFEAPGMNRPRVKMVRESARSLTQETETRRRRSVEEFHLWRALMHDGQEHSARSSVCVREEA